MTSSIWQADLSRRPQLDAEGKPLWELLICAASDDTTCDSASDSAWQFSRQACQGEITGTWVGHQLAEALAIHGQPSTIQVFRPQSFSLIATGAASLGLTVEASRRTPQLKALLQQQAQALQRQQGQQQSLGNQPQQSQPPQAQATPSWDPLAIEQLPPQPLPERLRGERWQFAALAAGEVEYAFRDRPIPMISAPDYALPIANGLSSDLPVPGLVIYAGRSARMLSQWLQSITPVELNYASGAPDGVILSAGLAERWVMATFEDPEVAIAAAMFQQRKQAAQGIHFLSIQPDDSGVTTSGFWLLRA
jgi:hypothetical protein